VAGRRVVAGERVDAWLDALASDADEPGGGAFSALSAAAGAALVAMVARQTVRRPGNEGATARMEELAAEADGSRPVLLGLADRDAEAHRAIVEAFRMPRDSDEERTIRLRVLQELLEDAADVQLDLARRAVYLMGLAEEATAAGNPNAAPAAMSAAAALHAAAVSALAHVEGDAFAIPESDRRAELTATCAALRERADAVLRDADVAFRARVVAP
jgi:methenyltetrahydrofolate cyclohydrolase